MTKFAGTRHLTVAYEEQVADPSGVPVVLLHGFPDDARAWDRVSSLLRPAGFRVIAPYLRGFGPTRFRDHSTSRVGQQAALAHDVLELLDALSIDRAILVGYDWGGRAACIIAALWPARVAGLVAISGYTIQNPFAPSLPADPRTEQRLWYQWYFSTTRGAEALRQQPRALGLHLWRSWSPGWDFSMEEFDRTAVSFDNPDFVEVVVHSYRHRHGWAPGAPEYEATEIALARRPMIDVPAVVLHGADDGVDDPAGSEGQERLFSSSYERRLLKGVGHAVPREAPRAVADAVIAVRSRAWAGRSVPQHGCRGDPSAPS